MSVNLTDMVIIGRVGTLLDVIQRASERLDMIASWWDAADENAPDMTVLFDRIDLLDVRFDRVQDIYTALIRDSHLTPDEDAVANAAFLEATGKETLTCLVG